MTHSLWMLTTQLPSMPCTWCPPTILVLMCTKHDVLVSEHKGRSAFPYIFITARRVEKYLEYPQIGSVV